MRTNCPVNDQLSHEWARVITCSPCSNLPLLVNCAGMSPGCSCLPHSWMKCLYTATYSGCFCNGPRSSEQTNIPSVPLLRIVSMRRTTAPFHLPKMKQREKEPSYRGKLGKLSKSQLQAESLWCCSSAVWKEPIRGILISLESGEPEWWESPPLLTYSKHSAQIASCSTRIEPVAPSLTP